MSSTNNDCAPIKYTTDLWFAAFLICRGYAVGTFEKTGPRRGSFGFALDEAQWKSLKLLFIDSEASQLKHAQEKLKDLLY